jgi:hydrogenase-4 component B
LPDDDDMRLFLLGSLAVVAAGMLALLANRSKAALWIAAIGVWVGCVMAAVPVVAALRGVAPDPLHIAWTLPGGSLSFGLDALSAFFCLPILIVAPLASLYACAYLPGRKRTLGAVSLSYNLLVASMLVLTAARNGLLFLVVWEIMAISSFILVVFDDEHAQVRQAGWIYLIATHIGTAALLVFFALFWGRTNSLDFDRLAGADLSGGMAGVLFVSAVIGFGTKAGFMPLHIWLPEAHPAAPSHVSALMSGVMIKTGVYGLLRALTLLGTPSVTWGWTLIVIGLVSGILGVAFALAQHDLKRLLAYHSVENIGIIAIGIGAGILGLCWNQPALVTLGFGGGILHVLNHAVFKSLLFLGAGAVAHSSGIRQIDQLGGLIRRMRWTGVTFLVGSAAICGLPPFNGFISEFLIYIAGFKAVRAASPQTSILAVGIVTGLALIGGLAAACFAKAFGVVFLGEPRTEHSVNVHEVGWAMRWPMVVLAAMCLGIGLLAPQAVEVVQPAVGVVAGLGDEVLIQSASGTLASLVGVVHVSVALLVLAGGLLFIRRYLPRGRQEVVTGTWDCGYARPTTRMQYTASSFAQPLADLFRLILGTRKHGAVVSGYFPKQADFETETPDAAHERLFAPLFRLVDSCAAPIRRVQHGRIHEYLLYIAITLVVLLIWKAGR